MPAHRSGFPLSARSAERKQLKFFALAALFFLLLAPVAWMTGASLWLVICFFTIAVIMGVDYALAVKELKDDGVGVRAEDGDPMAPVADPEDR